MAESAISVENLSKCYLIGHQDERRGTTLRDIIAERFSDIVRSARNVARGQPATHDRNIENFWALKDISFELKQGEVLGVIGRNGAGKSTLLKILSRITEPSSGRVAMRGRTASLLEVGTGFHGELTGRENIFLNGAILGMKRVEIQQKFDAIVAFSGIEKFLDTPVKRYSSGMYMRLAFAIAAHLEPEILIIDEVLAVGDVEFQKQCLGKIQSVAGDGRTVIFVSHQMSAVSRLCTRAVLLASGSLMAEGKSDDIIKQYLATAHSANEVFFAARPDKPTITRIAIDPAALAIGNIHIDIDYESPIPIKAFPGLIINSPDGTPLYGTNAKFHNDGYRPADIKAATVRVRCDGLPLTAGQYTVSFWLGDWHHDHDQQQDALQFDFSARPPHPLRPPSNAVGYFDWPAQWAAPPAMPITSSSLI